MQCPRCSLPLTDVGDIHACLRCNGVFLAAQANDTIRRALDDTSHGAAATVEDHGAGRLVNRGRASACPMCAAAMQRFRVGPVEVDTCMAHGSWYDRGELGLVREALLEGAPTAPVTPQAGLDKMAAPEAASSSSSGLELDVRAQEKARKAREARTPRATGGGGGGGFIDPSAQLAIQELQAHERRVERHRRHHHHGLFDDDDSDKWWRSSASHHHHHHSTGILAVDIIDTVFDLFD